MKCDSPAIDRSSVEQSTTGGGEPVHSSKVPQSTKRSFLIYAAAYAAAGGTPFLLLPILTRYLTPLQFGEVTSFLVLVALIGNFAGLSAHGFVAARFFKCEPAQFRKLVFSSLVTLTGVHVLALVLVVILFSLQVKLLELPLAFCFLAVVAALFLNLNQVFLAIFQFSGKPWFYLGARVLQGLIELALCLGLLLFVSANSGARIWSYVLALAASAAWGFYFCASRGQIASQAEGAAVRGLLRFGLPMLPHIGAGMAITYMDRLVLSSLLGAESLGIYMVAMQVGMSMIALIEPLNKALAPWLFEQLSKGDDAVRRMVVRRTYQLFAVLALVGLLIVMAAHLLFDELIGVRFTAARSLIPWMVTGFVLQGMYYCVVNYMFYTEKTGTLSAVTGSIAVVSCLVSYMLTSRFGLAGAGAAFVLNNSLLFLLVWIAASKAVPMPWTLKVRS